MRYTLSQLVVLLLLIAPIASAVQSQNVGLRVITVSTEAEAAELRRRALNGEPFSDLASAYSTDFSRASGGYIGTVAPEDLSPEYREALDGLSPGQISQPTEFGRQYLLVQLLSAAESSWLDETAAGLQALELGRFAEAQARLETAVTGAEAFGPTDYRLNISLSTLAGLHRVQGNFEEARGLYQRALEVTEAAVGTDHPDTAANLRNLGLLYQDRQEYGEAESFLERAQEILVGAFGPNHPNVAMGLGELARLRQAQGNYDRAEALYEVALSILEQALGPNDLTVAETLDGLAALLNEAGRPDDAARAAARVQSIQAAQTNE